LQVSDTRRRHARRREDPQSTRSDILGRRDRAD